MTKKQIKKQVKKQVKKQTKNTEQILKEKEDQKPKEKPEGYVFGRPTKYSLDVYVKAGEYMDACKDVFRHPRKGIPHLVKLPSKVGLANHLRVMVKTLDNWAEKHPDFLHVLETIHQEQKERLANSGLSGFYSASITKLMLMSSHGFKERSENDHQNNGQTFEPVQIYIPTNGREVDPEDDK